MSDCNVEAFKVELENKRIQLTSANEVAAQGAATVDLDQSKVGRLSRMDALQNQAISQSALLARQQEIRLIDAALLRIRVGEFGLCTACEETIDIRRLNHNPAASMCIVCAEQSENQS